MQSMDRSVENNVIEIIDDSDSEVVCLFSRSPVLRKSKEIEILDVDASDDDIEYIRSQPPSRVENRNLKKARRPSSKWIGQSTAKKIKHGVENGVAVHKVAVSRLASVRSDSNEARPLKKSSNANLPPKPSIATMRNKNATSNQGASTKPKSILRTNKLPVVNVTVSQLLPPSSSSTRTPMMNHPPSQHNHSDSSIILHSLPSRGGSRDSSKYGGPVIDLNDASRPTTPPVLTQVATNTDTANISLRSKSKSSHARLQEEHVRISKTDTDPLISDPGQSPSPPSTNSVPRQTNTDDSPGNAAHGLDDHSAPPPDYSDGTTQSLPLSIERCMSPSDAVDLFIYPLPDDHDVQEEVQTVEEEDINVRPSTPPLVNYRIEHIDIDNLLFDPALAHLDLAPPSDSDSTHRTPTATMGNDLPFDDGDNSSLCPPLTHEEQIPKKIKSAVKANDSIRPSVPSHIAPSHIQHQNQCTDDDKLYHADVSRAPGIENLNRTSPPTAMTNNCQQHVDSDNESLYPPIAHEQHIAQEFTLDRFLVPSIPPNVQFQKKLSNDDSLQLHPSSLQVVTYPAQFSDDISDAPISTATPTDIGAHTLFLGPTTQKVQNVEHDDQVLHSAPLLVNHRIQPISADNFPNTLSIPLDLVALPDSDSTERPRVPQFAEVENLLLNDQPTKEQQSKQERSHLADENSALRPSTSPRIQQNSQSLNLDSSSKSPKLAIVEQNPDLMRGIRTSPILRRREQNLVDANGVAMNDKEVSSDLTSSPASRRTQITNTDHSILNHAVIHNDEASREQIPTASDSIVIRTSTALMQLDDKVIEADNSPTYLSSKHVEVALIPTIPERDATTPLASKPPLIMFWSDCNKENDIENTALNPSVELIPLEDLDRDLPASMVIIPHLSRKLINSVTKLPIWEFSVYGEDDSTIYSFRAFAAKSKLPGAGMGAYIEFMGVKRLNKTSDERRLRLLYQLDHYESLTKQPLQAHPSKYGSGVTVFLKGNDLHGNRNQDFQLKQLNAVIPKNALRKKSLLRMKNEFTVRIKSEEDLQLNIEYDANYVHDDSPLHPIGHLRVQTDCDYYVDHSTTEYDSNLNCIDLGRYGPFQKGDRKAEDFFVLKSFIFSNVPAEWSFGAIETLHEMQQIIDITDDITGTPSNLARKEIPMYVNEVGYNKKFVQNVYIKDSDDERAIRYYFMPDAPMQKGVPIELLTNYKSAYESVRERKGYGQSNIDDGLKSDECRATCLQRNFLEREDIQNIVNDCAKIKRLRYLLNSIDGRIYSPLIKLLRNGQQLTSLQWVALRRIQWIINVFRQKFQNERYMLTEKKLSEKEEKLSEMEKKLNEMEKVFAHIALPFLRNHTSDAGITQRHAINNEMMSDINMELLEEVCFPLRMKLPYILDTSRYSPTAIQLIEALCYSIAEMLILREPVQLGKDVTMALHIKFIELSLHAKQNIFVGSQQSDMIQLVQVAVIVDVFASVYLKNSAYSMQNLCKTLDLDYEQAKAATKSLEQLLDRPTEWKNNKPCARKDGKKTRSILVKAEFVYSGPPTIPFLGNGSHWPDGWIQKNFKRASGATKGRIDCYWFPPEGGPKLRSRVEIRTYLANQARRST